MIQRLSTFQPLSSGLVLALKHSLTLVEFARGHLLVDVGKRQQLVWFMVSGTVKEVTPILKREWRAGSGSRMIFVFSYPSFFAHEPALALIETVEECRMLELSYSDFMVLKDRFMEMQLLVEWVRSRYAKVRVSHASDLVSLSAKERYNKFYAAHKKIFNVTKHKDIASFLGIRDDGFHRYQ